jgi:N-acetylmuramoyl-L-alanine amidase
VDGILRAVTFRSLAVLAALSIVVVPALSAPAPVDPGEQEERELPLATLTASFEMEDERLPLGVALMSRGPLFDLQTIVGQLGGSLKIGPLRQSHELELAGTSFLFGPESAALTVGQEIIELSQPPVAGETGLRVPLDLLEAIYTEIGGKRFSWVSAQRRLVVGSNLLRDLPVTVDIVHLQGVSTVVLRFPSRPRYRVAEEQGRITVHVLGDRLRGPSNVPRSRDGLLRGLEFGEQDITLRLQPGSGTESYELSDPYRLVFDVFPGGQVEQGPTTAPRLPPRRSRTPTIVIDPGHGGGDDGAIGDGLVEKELTLRLARLLRGKLVAALPVRVVLTRDEDADLPLDTRSSIANQLKAELFISLHLNSSYGQRAAGAETYFLSLDASDERAQLAAEEANQGLGRGDPLTDLQLILWDMAQSRHLAASQQLASLIQEELNATLGIRNRGVKQAPFAVLMGAAMPAVLVEVGFLSNPQEVQRLQDPLYQNQLAEALTRALVRYRAPQLPASTGGIEVPE